MTILRAADIARTLPMAVAIQAMRRVFAAHAQGQIQAPPRAVLRTGNEGGATLVMPAAWESGERPLLTTKVVSVFPGNSKRGLPAIHGAVLATDPSTGTPLALLDGASLTAIRTGAVCGVATDLLARPDSRELAVFGSGVQARTQVRAIRAVRPIEAIRICSRRIASARAMAEELAAHPEAPVKAQAVAAPAEALRKADIACLATTSRVPVFDDREVPAGIHLNAIGSFRAEDRELPGETVARARVVVDDRAAALEEAGDLLIPIREGLFTERHIHCDLGALVLGASAGRMSPSEVTVFKSVGLPAQDVAVAQAVLAEAERLGLGERIAW